MTRWKFDADPYDPLVTMRIPVTGRCPGIPYLAAFHKESAKRPTPGESLMLASFIEMVKVQGFSVVERQDMDGETFDFHPRATTAIFHKYAVDDWGWRRNSWQTDGFAPPSPRVATRATGPLSLLRLMDLIWSDPFDGVDEQWRTWKAAHAEVFAP